jgi:ketosteroid isomerase-like protein
MATTDAERRNLATVARAFEAFARRDVATLAAAFHADACWRVAPAGVLKGNYRGRDQILGFFAHLAHETAGTFRIVPIAMAADGDRVFVLNELSATRKGADWTWHVVLLFDLVDDVAVAVHQYVLDHPAIRRFWT